MKTYMYTNKDFFEYQFYFDRDYFGFENLIHAIHMLIQVSENNLLLTGHYFNRAHPVYKNEIPDYPLVDSIDKYTYDMWRGWYDLKEDDVKDL